MEEEEDKKYYCYLCQSTFDNKSNYNRHRRKKKSACVSQEQVEEMYEENKTTKTKLEHFQSVTAEQKQIIQQKESELEQLKRLVNNLSDKDTYVRQAFDQVVTKLDVVQDTIEDSKDNFFSAANQQVIHNNTLVQNNNLFNVLFTKPRKERLDHITKDMLLQILDHENVNDAWGDLARSIYFHPKAPENWKWTILDIHDKFGTLEYCHETNTLTRKCTIDVIKRNMENVLFPVSDLLDELRKTRNFNKPQAINCSILMNQVGQDFTPSQVNSVKDSAYAGRNFPKTLWDSLSIKVETTTLNNQIKIK